mgnify:CR=1
MALNPLPADCTALMSCALVTLFRSSNTVAEVFVADAVETPSTFESADCTFGAQAETHLRPVRARVTVSALASAAIGLAVVSAELLHETTPNIEQAAMPATISLCVFFMVTDSRRGDIKFYSHYSQLTIFSQSEKLKY